MFAFEGDWHQNLRNMSSMRPTLETLRDIFGADGLEFSHRRIGTADELEYYVDKWLSEEPGESYDDYRVGYFAFHGGQGLISPGGGDVSLDDLAGWINGRAQGRTLYFASCSTLDLETERIKDFLRSTGARAVVGSTKSVANLELAAFDLLLLEALACYHRRPHAADSVLIPNAPADTVAALGAMGQFCLVTPSHQAVVVRLGSAPRGDLTGGDVTSEIWQLLNQTLFRRP